MSKSTNNTVAVKKTDLAIGIVSRVYAQKVDGVSSRQRALAELEAIGLTAATARQTYLQNALAALRTANNEEAIKRLEKNKPVWSVVKVNNLNIVSAVGLFISATSAKDFNETFEHHAVVKGVVELGDEIDAKMIKRVPKAPRAIKAKKEVVTAKVVAKKTKTVTIKKAASTKKAA